MKTNKTLYRILLLAGFILINTAILFGISQVIAYLNTGADRSKMVHLDTTKERNYVPEVIWQSLENPGRPIEDASKRKIEEDYLDAWYVKNTAYSTGNDAGIFDHYTASARQKVRAHITQLKTEDTYIESTTIAHHLSLEFYSADGTLAVLTDRNVRGVEHIFKGDQFLYERKFNEDYRIILLLEDGFWRIRHFEKIAAHKEAALPPAPSLEVQLLEGINYYPQKTPWDTFGTEFEATVFETDFRIIKDLGLNSLRVFIGYQDFGAANVIEEKLLKLEVLLDEAQKRELKVMLTLFDFYGDYDIQDWTLTNKHVHSIVGRVKDHPALLGWDLKNEPDLDFKSRGGREVRSWLSQSRDYLKLLDPSHPITIGWSSPEAATYLIDEVDVVSYHFYRDLEELAAAHQKVTASTTKPVILQEFGLSSYHGIWNVLGADEEDQAVYYQDFFKIQKRDSIHYLSWTLYDFKGIPNRVAGRLPWRKHKQAFFGIIDTLGVKDDAYLVLKNR